MSAPAGRKPGSGPGKRRGPAENRAPADRPAPPAGADGAPPRTFDPIVVRRLRARGCVLVTVVATAWTMAGGHSSVRAVLALAFMLFVPGNAIVSEVGLDDPLAEATLAAALSLVIATAVAMAMIWCRAWNPAAAEVVLAAASLPWSLRQAGWWNWTWRGRTEGVEP